MKEDKTKNVCITVPISLLRKLDEFPEINRSRLFQEAAYRRLKIIDEIKLAKDVPDKLTAMLVRVLEDVSESSFDFGKDIFYEWVVIDHNYKYISSIINFNVENNFEDIYNELGNVIEPIRDIEEYEKEYQKLFRTETGTFANLDRNEFARGFIAGAHSANTILKNLMKK